MRYALPFAFFLFTSPALAATLECRGIGISDGDTLTCLTADKRQEKIRLRGIDAPEHKQPFGERSRQYLSDLAFGKPVTVHWTKRDRWGRIVGAVWVEPADCPGCGHTLDTGAAQLSVGMAWWYRAYAKEQPRQERHQYELEEAEAQARAAGLWHDADPVPPWDWRRKKH